MKHSLPFVIILLFLLTVFLCANSTVFAQQSSPKIHPTLQVVLIDASANEMVDVYAVFKDQFPFDDLGEQTLYLPRKEIQKEVARILKEFAAEKQQAVLEYLGNAKQQNLVSKLDILWAVNTVVFSAVPQVIYGLAENFDEIYEIRYDAPIDESELIDPTERSQSVFPGDGEALTTQQGLILINAPAVWAEGDSGAGVLVANIDTGCDWDHPDLINNIWNNLGEDYDGDGHTLEWNGSAWVFDPGDINGVDDDTNGKIDDFIGWNFSQNNNNPLPNGNHGTKTSGLVCGDGTNGIQTGVAPRAKLMILRPSGEGQILLAMQYAVDNGVDVTTSSLSLKWDDHQPNYALFRQMTDVELAAVVVHTNSISNDGNNLGGSPIPYNIATPGNYPPSWLHPDQTLIGGLSSVIGVGNVHAFSDVIESNSPYGPSAWEDIHANHPFYPYNNPPEYWDYPFETQPGSIGLIKPDVSAPGSGTTSTDNGVGYSSFSGTSGATPHVAGTVALILSINPNLTPAEVSMIIQTTAVEKGTPGKDNRYGAGRIDAYEAYLLALAMIPVELTSFKAISDGEAVILNWQTTTEINNQGFEIQRSNNGEFEKIGFVAGHGTTTEIHSYTFIDENVLPGDYSYRLKQVDYDGTTEYSNIVEVEVTQPIEYSLSQNYPNPFNPSTAIAYSIPKDGLVTLKVYDVLGRDIVALINEVQSAGSNNITFDASELSSGVYYYQLVSGEFTSTKKLILMK